MTRHHDSPGVHAYRLQASNPLLASRHERQPYPRLVDIERRARAGEHIDTETPLLTELPHIDTTPADVKRAVMREARARYAQNKGTQRWN